MILKYLYCLSLKAIYIYECNSFRFSESFFDKSICVDMDSDNENQNENVDDIYDELKDIKKKHPNKCIC
jgi:hypothetical protein